MEKHTSDPTSIKPASEKAFKSSLKPSEIVQRKKPGFASVEPKRPTKN